MKEIKTTCLLIFGLFLAMNTGCSDKNSSNIDLDNGLVASLNFDNNLNDQSGNGNDGTAFGGSYFLRSTGNWDYKLNGAGEYIKIDSDPSLNSADGVTISVWIKPESFYGTGNDAIVMKPLSTGLSPYYQYKLGILGSNGHYQLYFQLNTDGVIKTLWARTTWTPGEWYNIVGLFISNKIKIYVNGLLEYTFNAMGYIPANTTDIYIGKNTFSGGTIPGEIDNLRIYNRGLTGEEVWKLYQEELE